MNAKRPLDVGLKRHSLRNSLRPGTNFGYNTARQSIRTTTKLTSPSKQSEKRDNLRLSLVSQRSRQNDSVSQTSVKYETKSILNIMLEAQFEENQQALAKIERQPDRTEEEMEQGHNTVY